MSSTDKECSGSMCDVNTTCMRRKSKEKGSKVGENEREVVSNFIVRCIAKDRRKERRISRTRNSHFPINVYSNELNKKTKKVLLIGLSQRLRHIR